MITIAVCQINIKCNLLSEILYRHEDSDPEFSGNHDRNRLKQGLRRQDLGQGNVRTWDEHTSYIIGAYTVSLVTTDVSRNEGWLSPLQEVVRKQVAYENS